MTGEIVNGLVRHLITIAGGALVSKGYVDASTVEQLSGVALSIAGIAWSAYAKQNTPELVVSPPVVTPIVAEAVIPEKEYSINNPSGFMFSDRSLKSMEGIDPLLRKVADTAIELSTVDFAVTEGVRSAERQKELVNAGRSWISRSKHQDKLAIDVAAFPAGSTDVSWEWEHYEKINEAFQKSAEINGARITWGGNWKQRDGAHFQLEGAIIK